MPDFDRALEVDASHDKFGSKAVAASETYIFLMCALCRRIMSIRYRGVFTKESQ